MIELKTLSNVYKDKVIEEQVHEVLHKKDVISLKLVDPNDITSVQEVLTEQGKIYKTRCMIHIQGEGHMIVKHKYSEMKQLKIENKTIIGYGRS